MRDEAGRVTGATTTDHGPRTTDHLLDITGDVCPMTLVRVRMALDKVAPGAVLKVKMAAGEPVASIPRTLRGEGHELLCLERVGDHFEAAFRKKTQQPKTNNR